MVLLFTGVRGTRLRSAEYSFSPTREEDSVLLGAERFPESFASGGPISFSSERNGAAGGIHAGRGCSPQSENAQRAVEDAGPYGVRLSGCAGIRETADMGATVPLHDNRPARRRAVRGSGSGSYRRVPEPVIARHPRGAWERQRGWERKRFPMGLFASYHVRRKGIPKTMGLWRRFCIIFPPRAKGFRAGARNIPAGGTKGTSNGPSGTPAPTQ